MSPLWTPSVNGSAAPRTVAGLALYFAKMLLCLGFAVERSDLNQPSPRRVELLLDGLFGRDRFRFGGFRRS